jgi:hypothetical protein
VREVVNVDELRRVVGLPLDAAVLEIADQLLLLRVDRDEWCATLDSVRSLAVDVLELRVAVGMLLALDCLRRAWRL